MEGPITMKQGGKWWTGSGWTTNHDEAREYVDRDDFMEKEKANLGLIDYGWKYFLFKGFCPNLKDGMAWAVARDEDEAKDLIRAKYKEAGHDKEPWEWGKMTYYSLDDLNKRADFVCGGG